MPLFVLFLLLVFYVMYRRRKDRQADASTNLKLASRKSMVSNSESSTVSVVEDLFKSKCLPSSPRSDYNSIQSVKLAQEDSKVVVEAAYRYQVLSSYHPSKPDEITILEGDIVVIEAFARL